MAVTTAVLSGNIADLGLDIASNYLARVILVIESNTTGSLLRDTDGNTLLAGAKRVTIDRTTGAYSQELVTTDSTDIVPADDRLYRATLIYPNGHPGRGNVTVSSGWFELTADASLSDADIWQGIEVTAVSSAVYESISTSVAAAQLAELNAETAATSAAASAAEATAIVIADADTAMAAAINTPGSDTETALSATIAAVTDPLTADVIDLRSQIVPMATSGSVVILDLPEVPTITVPADANSTIATGTTYTHAREVDGVTLDLDGDPAFEYLGVPSMSEYPTGNPFVRPPLITGGAGQNAYWTPTIRFETDAPYFEIRLRFSDTLISSRISIDGQWVENETTFAGTAGTTRYIKFEFSTAKTRLIEFTLQGSQAFSSVRVPATYDVWRPVSPASQRMFVVGDSFTGGAFTPPDGARRVETWPWFVAKTLGIKDLWHAGIGGTGWATDGASTTRFSNRVDVDLEGQAFDLGIFFGSINDSGKTSGEVQTEAELALSKVTHVPEVYVIGEMPVSGGTSTRNVGLAAAAAAYGRTFINPEGWISGTGTLSAPTGDGNADRYRSADGIHLTQVAHTDYLPYKILTAINAARG